jgi:hypothetical protein
MHNPLRYTSYLDNPNYRAGHFADHPISRIADLLPWNLAESLDTSQAA